MKMTKTKAVITLLIFVVVFAYTCELLQRWRKGQPYQFGVTSAVANVPIGAVPSELQTGDFYVTITTEWSPPIKNSWYVRFYDAVPITKGFYWEVRYDEDDNKVYRLPPIDVPGDHVFNYTNTWTTIQWRISPESAITVGNFTYKGSLR